MTELDNFEKEKLTIDLVWANIFGLLIIFPIILIFGLPYFLIWHDYSMSFQNIIHSISFDNVGSDIFTIIGVMFIGIIVHELIHGVTWAGYTKNGFKSIKFGIMWKMLTPYCHCKEPLKVKHYIYGAITPAITLGIIPSILAIIIGNIWLLAFGIFFTIAAAGDFLIIDLIRKENKDDLVEDHPSEAGCYIYRKIK